MVLQFLILLTWFGLANPQWNYKVSDYDGSRLCCSDAGLASEPRLLGVTECT